MEYVDKTKEQLIDELENKLQRILELEELYAKSMLNEDELKASEERMNILFEYAPDAYYLSNIKGELLDGNKAAEEMVGYKKEELIGKNFSDLKILPKNQLPQALKNLAKNALGFPTGPDEFTLTPKDGKQITTEISTYPVKIKGKKLVLGIARDITERKKIEIALKESEDKYRSIFENSMDAVLLTKPNGNLLDVNTAAEKLFGYSKKEMIEFGIHVLVDSDDPILSVLIEEREHKGKKKGELIFIKKDGSKFPAETSSYIFHDNDGNKITSMIIEDISDRLKAKEILKESEEKYRELFNNANDQISVIEIKADGFPGNFIEMNEVGLKRLGYSHNDLSKMTVVDLIAPDKRSEMRKHAIELQNKGHVTFETVNITKDGGKIPVEISNHLFEINGKKFAHAVVRDISDRKKAEKALKKSEMKYKKIFDTVQDVFFQTDTEGNITEISPSVERYSGYKPEELIGKPVEMVYSNLDDRNSFLKEFEEKGELVDYELKLKTKKEDLIYSSINAQLLLDSKNKPIGIEGTLRDVTERKKVEEAIMISEEKYRNLIEKFLKVSNEILIEISKKD